MMTQFEIPSKILKYILYQRTQYLNFPKNPIYSKLSRTKLHGYLYKVSVDLESKIRSQKIKDLFFHDMMAEYQSIKSHLPDHCEEILDIGCGVGGIDILLNSHFGNNAKFYFLDKSKIEEDIYYGFKSVGAFYNSLEVTKEFVEKNGVRNGVFVDANEKSLDQLAGSKGLDVVISLISWGWHYPVETYLSQVFNLLKPQGTLIIDVRRESEGLTVLEKKFGNLKIIGENKRGFRVLCKKDNL